MSADVHLLLDMHDCTWLQVLSCWLLQYWDSHLLSSLSQPIQVCLSSISVEGVLESVWVPLDHASRWDNRVSHTTGSVPRAHSHCFSLSRLMVHCCLAPGAGHCMMCCLSSIFSWHQGHCAKDLCPLCCMFSLCANCLVICFDTHLLVCVGTSCIALSMAYRSSLLRPGDKLGSFLFQYAQARGPLSTFWTSCFGCLTVLCLAISRCQGLYGSWYAGGPWCFSVICSFVRRSATMLSHVTLDSTVRWPLSCCPLICW